MSKSWVLAIILSIAVSPACDAQDSDQETARRIESLFADISENDPGCAVGIVREGETILKRGFGLASVAFDAPNESSTVFEIASGSKTVTSACIALLMDQGKIHPDDDVRDHIPELNLNKAVRIRHLLRCESGVWAQFHIMPLAGWSNVPVHSPYTKNDFLTVLSGQRRLPFEPGSDFQYGSGDTFLLGIVVERVSGKPLAEFAKEFLFKPLGMTRTWFLEDPAAVVKNRAVGHWKSPAGWASGDHFPATAWYQWNASAFLGGGGSVVTCVDDLLRWSRIYQEELLPRGKYIDELTREGSVLGNRFVLDVDAYLKRMNKHPENPPPGTYRGAPRIQITGGYWGFTCCLSHFPNHDTTIICLSNSDSISAIVKAKQMADVVLEDVFSPRPDAAKSDEKEKFSELTNQQLKRFEGSYRRKGNHPILRINAAQGSLRVVNGFGDTAILRPLSQTRFKPVGSSGFYPSAVFDFEVRPESGLAVSVALASFDNGLHEEYIHQRVQEAEDYDDDALRQFSGTYISDELGAIYRFRVGDGHLELRVGSRRWEPMKPLEADEFSPIVKDPHNTRFIRFTRNDAGSVDGFSVGFWRIRSLRFRKLE
jgi:CubicO group peptidase (beta-lactamase class C family)